MNKPVIILGNGGHASVLTEILIANSRKIIGFTAPRSEENAFGIPYIGNDNVIYDFSPDTIELVLGLGTVTITSTRQKMYQLFVESGYMFTNVIHESAIISPSVKMGRGTQIMAGAIIQTNTIIADNTIVNTGTVVDHDCQIDSHTHLAPGVTISGGAHIGTSCHIGTGATIIQGISVGAKSLVGAGAVVISSIAMGKKVIGVPAKEV